MLRGIVEKPPRIVRRVTLAARREHRGVGAQQLAQHLDIRVGRRFQAHLRALREAVAHTALVEAAFGGVPQEHDAAAHAGTDPAAGIAEHDRAPTGHVLEGEAAQVAAEHDVRARQPNPRARIGTALHEEAAALRAVGEALPHRAVDPRAGGVLRLEYGDRAAERGLGRAVLRAALDDQRDAIARVRAEAIAGDGALTERALELRDRGSGDGLPRERARLRRRDEPVLAAEPHVLETVDPLRRCARSGDHPDLASTVATRSGRREERREVDAVVAARLHQEVGAADELLGALDAEVTGDARDLPLHLVEEVTELRHRAVHFDGLEALEAALRRFDRRHDLRRDADVACVELAAAADRAADRDHRERPETDTVGAEAQHLHDVERALHPAVARDLPLVAQARRDERAMPLGHADLRGEARAAQRVLPRGAGAAVVSGERDDVRAGFRDADRDDADVRHDRDLHRHARARIDRFQLVDDLREILDRVDVVIVRRADEVDAGLRVARERDLHRDLARGQVPALAGLRPLADLDLEVVRRVREERRHTEATGGDLLAAIARVLPDEVGQLAALAVHAQEVHARHRLGIRAVRGLALRPERHRPADQ